MAPKFIPDEEGRPEATFRRKAVALVDLGGFRVDLRADLSVRRVQRTADRGRADDDGDGDEAADQRVFDGGRARFVIHETCEKLRHCLLHFVCNARAPNNYPRQ